MRSVVVVLVFLTVGVVHADLYKYRDPATGRLVISNQPPPKDAAVEAQLPAGTPPAAPIPLTPLSEAPVPRATWRDTPAAPAVPGWATPAPAHRTAPVDTRELGFIQPGMSAGEVQRRLGPPARVLDLGTVYRVIRDRRQTFRGPVAGPDATAVPLAREAWVYPGNSRVGTAVIELVNGEVECAERVR